MTRFRITWGFHETGNGDGTLSYESYRYETIERRMFFEAVDYAHENKREGEYVSQVVPLF